MVTYVVRRSRQPPRRVKWQPIIERAADVVDAHSTMMTVRQVFYRLVSEGRINNTRDHYNQVCRLSAQARRDGWFPRLLDQGRRIERPMFYKHTNDALRQLRSQYRLDRTRGQRWNVYVAAEKSTLLEQLEHWFSDRGIPVFALRGYSGQELVTDVQESITVDGRRSVLLYAGDLDPSGEDIDDEFVHRVDGFDRVHRVALTEPQVRRFNLPPQVGKASDPRADAFIDRHGRLVQVELEALDPDDLHDLYERSSSEVLERRRLQQGVEAGNKRQKEAVMNAIGSDGSDVSGS